MTVQGTRGATVTRPPSDAEVAAWLIADEESEAPERLADVYSGETRVGDALPEPATTPQAASAQPAPKDASESAYDLLKAMTVRRPG